MTRRKASLILLVFVFLLSLPFSSGEQDDSLALFLENPSLSADGKMIAFDYCGDIWTVPISDGEAKRLTIHACDEKRPIFSPDGKWIVFSGAYYGNLDLFVMPSDGGVPRRLTFSSGNELPSAWSTDGRYIYFFGSEDGSLDCFKIPFHGGMPLRLLRSERDTCYNASPSPNGQTLIFNHRGNNSGWSRTNFRNPSRPEIYIAANTTPASDIRRLTNNWVAEYLPQWNPDGSKYYFVSDADGSYNLYVADSNSSEEAKQITKLAGTGIRWYSVASLTGSIVARIDYRLYSIDPNTGQSELIPIRAYNPRKYDTNDIQEETAVNSYAVSPDGAKIALVIGHDVFVSSSSGGYAKRLTNTYEREQHVVWMPDSRTILFNRLIDGALNVVQVDVVTGTEQILTRGHVNSFTPTPSPDGKWVYVHKDFDEFVRMRPDGTVSETVLKGSFPFLILWHGAWFQLTRDSKWLVYRESNEMMEHSCMVLKLDGESQPICLNPLGGSSYPVGFSPDYTNFFFINNESGTSLLYRIEFEDTSKPKKSEVEVLEDLLTPPSKEEKTEKSEPNAQKKTNGDSFTPITENLIEKVKRIAPTFAGAQNSAVVLPDGSLIFIGNTAGQDNLYRVYFSPTERVEQLTQTAGTKAALSIDDKGAFAYYIASNAVFKLDLKTKKLDRIQLTNKIIRQFDVDGIRKAVFDEAVWIIDFGFYDPNHHGKDIAKMKGIYGNLIQRCDTDAQYDALLADFLSDLNASHMGFYGRQSFPRTTGEAREANPHIGFFYDNALAEKGILRISRLVEGTPFGDNRYGLKVGDYIHDVNGKTFSADVNIHSLLRNCPNNELKLRVSDNPDGNNSRIVWLKAISGNDYRRALSNSWVTDNRRYVEQKSGNKLGYILITQMNTAEYNRFLAEASRYMANFKGLVLDFRYNGGGSTAHKFAEVLDDAPWLMRKMRGGRDLPEDVHRDFSYQKPVAGMFNAYSFSNAEMMCAAFRIKKLGPSIGVPTAGGVIGTWQKNLLDGSSMRLPQFGIFDVEGRNLELSPTEPEYIVDEDLIDEIAGRKPQLDKAIELLLSIEK